MISPLATLRWLLESYLRCMQRAYDWALDEYGLYLAVPEALVTTIQAAMLLLIGGWNPVGVMLTALFCLGQGTFVVITLRLQRAERYDLFAIRAARYEAAMVLCLACHALVALLLEWLLRQPSLLVFFVAAYQEHLLCCLRVRERRRRTATQLAEDGA